jgi:large subunit ribosomal protein L22
MNMQQARAETKYVRVSPRKARLAADLIRGLKVEEATVQLSLCGMKAGKLLQKTLDSAVANAETVHNIQRRDLKVQEIRVDVGPVIKRAKSKSRGGRVPVMKRMSHFTIIVGTSS